MTSFFLKQKCLHTHKQYVHSAAASICWASCCEIEFICDNSCLLFDFDDMILYQKKYYYHLNISIKWVGDRKTW